MVDFAAMVDTIVDLAEFFHVPGVCVAVCVPIDGLGLVIDEHQTHPPLPSRCPLLLLRCSGGWWRRWPEEGSCRSGPAEPAAPRG